MKFFAFKLKSQLYRHQAAKTVIAVSCVFYFIVRAFQVTKFANAHAAKSRHGSLEVLQKSFNKFRDAELMTFKLILQPHLE